MTATITDFIVARLAEDAEWDWLICPACGTSERHCQRSIEGGAIKCCPDCRHPERWMAEIAAKRKILLEHEMTQIRPHDKLDGYWWDAYCRSCTMDGEYTDITQMPTERPCSTIRAIAGVYSDHPDYRSEWGSGGLVDA